MAKVQKLLRKDVLKLIDNLTSGKYVKEQGQLVKIDEKGNSGFCCLGVWADQHGCVWHNILSDHIGEWAPSLSNTRLDVAQKSATGTLKGKLAFGLEKPMQDRLASLNDANDTWKEVLHYLVDEVLPKAV